MNHNHNPSYILFIDESGKSKFSDESDNFLLSGVIIDKDLNIALSNYMTSLKRKNKIPITENIHAYDLFEAEKCNKKRRKFKEIDTFFNQLCSLIRGAEFRTFIVRVDKTIYKEKIAKVAKRVNKTDAAVTNFLKRSDLHDFLYEVLARKLILKFGRFLEQENSIGEVFAESRRWDDEAVLRAFVDSTQSSRFKEGSTYSLWSHYSFERIHSLVFQNKKGLNFGLEIADLFAWAYLNDKYGLQKKYLSNTKVKRIKARVSQVRKIMTLLSEDEEEISPAKVKTIAADRVSKFNESLKNFRQL